MRRFLRVEELADGTVPKRRHQTGLSEQSNFSKLIEVENNSPFFGHFAQNAHHAVAARLAMAHDAGIARDHEHGLGAVGCVLRL
jgi:hypothetical protein